MGVDGNRRRRSASWRSWSGTVRCEPAELARPRGEDEIRQLVEAAARRDLPVRAAGTGHSFNPLATTDGVLIDLSGFTGVTEIDTGRRSVTVSAGTSLAQLNEELWRAGLSLPNIGTLAEQTVAGAVSTGNHGTGVKHPPLSGLVSALRLVTADGQVRALDQRSDPELLRCARTALGALGVITSVTLQCTDRFHLRAVTGTEPLSGLLERFDEWAVSADHVAFSWRPWGDNAATKALHPADPPASRYAGWRRYRGSVEELRCGLIGQLGRVFPPAVPRLLDRTGRSAGDAEAGSRTGSYVDASYRVFTFPQPVRFIALEHALPLAQVPEAVRRLRGVLRRSGRQSPYPVLVRVGAADDAPLSPAYGRATGYVNVTVPRSAAFLEVLRSVEHVLGEFGARPHWGKAHAQTAATLAGRYPEWSLFQRARAELDPEGRFRNDYLDRVLGPPTAPKLTQSGPRDTAR